MLSQTITHEPTNSIIILKILKLRKRQKKKKKAIIFHLKSYQNMILLPFFGGQLRGMLNSKKFQLCELS